MFAVVVGASFRTDNPSGYVNGVLAVCGFYTTSYILSIKMHVVIENNRRCCR